MWPAEAVSAARVTYHSTLKTGLFDVSGAHFLEYMTASNGSIPVHSKLRYFRWFSIIIRHTESISIFQNASKCTISTFSA